MPHFSRRKLLSTASLTLATGQSLKLPCCPLTPSRRRRNSKLCLKCGGGLFASGTFDKANMLRIKQPGVNHVIGGEGPMPWSEEQDRQHDRHLLKELIFRGELNDFRLPGDS